jgi:Arc/MetJ family transcription regulator
MRTTVDLDEELLKRARALTGIKTKRKVIHEALRVLIQLHQQEDVRSLCGKLRWG